ncbi:tRNA 2-thiouridine(34) synthase MnmA [Haliangium ochraceum]|uniref:tRNA-specific 2-thiouridylase MnmA n=1 Tax=Haliangium ochraceum (strain DSM 14365 / JCM 11303 / SMP-2) TaxID=502025 RepID=D0LWB4_HALO1|nr:tRNA 2-thiouridine(34) synthase MnmA [Haliangium ochraceum]ACY16046.1 tRNA(5-methylaminomethyl-2-thiouridylate)-methyl transferase [Haliangium ochraceum DSM 14365]
MAAQSLIVAALSGGVDSAVTAAMLVEQGHRVVGMTMRLYDASGTSASVGGRCCGPRDIEDARRVCAHLGIPFYVVNFEVDFAHTVIDDFVDTYLAGETPNPCVKCNQHIKFTPLLARARALGAETVATGHYARLEDTGAGIRLRRGRDASKDQSYFLFSMPREELASVRFPLGAMTKDEVRDKARAYGLPNAAKADSQEICFVPDGDYAGFVEAEALRRSRPVPASGDIVDGEGQVLGRHRGVHHYTIGQRRGLGNLRTQTRSPTPLYVIGVDRARDRVVVGPREQAARRSVPVRDVRWLSTPPAEGRLSAGVQVRYRSSPLPATLELCGEGDERGKRVRVHFDDAAVIASPGQAAVFYDGDTVLGGGWIARDEQPLSETQPPADRSQPAI